MKKSINECTNHGEVAVHATKIQMFLGAPKMIRRTFEPRHRKKENSLESIFIFNGCTIRLTFLAGHLSSRQAWHCMLQSAETIVLGTTYSVPLNNP